MNEKLLAAAFAIDAGRCENGSRPLAALRDAGAPDVDPAQSALSA